MFTDFLISAIASDSVSSPLFTFGYGLLEFAFQLEQRWLPVAMHNIGVAIETTFPR